MSKEFIKRNASELRETMRTKISGYLLAGFGVVAGLAWNEAIKAFIERFFPASEGSDILAKFIYAIVITIFVVIMMFVVAKVFKTEQKSSK